MVEMVEEILKGKDRSGKADTVSELTKKVCGYKGPLIEKVEGEVDWKRLGGMIMEVERSAFEEDTHYPRHLLKEEFLAPNTIFLVAWYLGTNEVVGYTMASPSYGQREGDIHITSTGVKKGHQGRGVGTKLKRRLIKECKKEGYNRITTETTGRQGQPKEESPVYHINKEKFGFREAGPKNPGIGDRWEIYMVKGL